MNRFRVDLSNRSLWIEFRGTSIHRSKQRFFNEEQILSTKIDELLREEFAKRVEFRMNVEIVDNQQLNYNPILIVRIRQ